VKFKNQIIMANYWDGAYDLDIAVDIVNTLWVQKDKALDKETNLDTIEKLKQELEILNYERTAIYRSDAMQGSIVDKALRLYAPILKQRNGKD
jgi:hypothetical protein